MKARCRTRSELPHSVQFNLLREKADLLWSAHGPRWQEAELNVKGAVFQPELIKLMKAILDDAAMALPEAKRTSAMKTEIASHILACAAKGERDPVVLKMNALLAVAPSWSSTHARSRASNQPPHFSHLKKFSASSSGGPPTRLPMRVPRGNRSSMLAIFIWSRSQNNMAPESLPRPNPIGAGYFRPPPSVFHIVIRIQLCNLGLRFERELPDNFNGHRGDDGIGRQQFKFYFGCLTFFGHGSPPFPLAKGAI
jgi:hypothetical protein